MASLTISSDSRVYMLRPDLELAQFMNRAKICPVHEPGKSAAQFMNWADICPVRELGQPELHPVHVLGQAHLNCYQM